MNVLHISESDGGGGAGLASHRLHDGLRRVGVRSRMLVGNRVTSDPDVRPLKRNVLWRAADRAAAVPLDALGLQYVFYPSSFGVALDPWLAEADVVQLHNLHGSYFAFPALPLLARRRRLVWVLQDMWALTGHVAYSYGCELWRTGCGACPHLDVYPSLPRDTSAFLWRLKRRVYAKARPTLVVPCRWLERLVAESPLLSDLPLRHIPNGVDTERFSPGSQAEARSRLGLPADRLIVLFISAELADPRKGLDLLEVAVRGLSEPPLVALMGEGPGGAGLDSHRLGLLGQEQLADAYRAADVVAFPSRADTFPNVTLESLACGTPCVVFDTGGTAEAVRHLETGYVAPFADTAELARGLHLLLSDVDLRARLGASGRRVAVEEYTLELQARRYTELYEEVLRAG